MRRIGGTLFGAGANLLAQGVPFVLLLFVTPVLIRALGRETYGALILFNLLPQIAGQLDLGLVTAGTRAYAQFAARRQFADAKRVIWETLAILCAWGALLAVCLVVWQRQIAAVLRLDEALHGDRLVFTIAAFAIPLALINGAALIPLRAVEQYGRAARIQIVAGLVYWSACTVAAIQGAPFAMLVLLGTVTIAVTSLVLFVSVARDDRKRRATDDPADAVADAAALDVVLVDELSPTAMRSALRLRPFLSLGAGTFVAQASSLATYHTDKLLVSALISPAAAGAYAICANIANKILLVVASGATYTFPRAARLHATGDHDAVVRTYVVTTRFVLMVAAAIAVPLIALAPAFLRTWIGADFADAYAPIMQLLVAGYAINASSVVASNVAIGIGQARLPALFALLGGATTIVAVVVLTPPMGAAGAALAAALGMSQALIFNAMVAAKLGPGALRASWFLMIRLVAVAIPVAIVTVWSSAWAVGWLSLLGIGILSAASFLVLWLATFGRHDERLLIDALVARARLRPSRTH